MAAGLPVVASRTKIDEFYFDDSMIMFFEAEDYQELARCIIEVYHNPGRRQSLVEHGKRFIATNNWEVKKKEYYEIIDNLLKGRRISSEENNSRQ
jgi:glycosyltransferase involved in cell wall biosynthesis